MIRKKSYRIKFHFIPFPQRIWNSASVLYFHFDFHKTKILYNFQISWKIISHYILFLCKNIPRFCIKPVSELFKIISNATEKKTNRGIFLKEKEFSNCEDWRLFVNWRFYLPLNFLCKDDSFFYEELNSEKFKTEKKKES